MSPACGICLSWASYDRDYRTCGIKGGPWLSETTTSLTAGIDPCDQLRTDHRPQINSLLFLATWLKRGNAHEAETD